MNTKDRIDRLYARYEGVIAADHEGHSDAMRIKSEKRANNYLRQIESLFVTREEFKAFIQSKVPLVIKVNRK